MSPNYKLSAKILFPQAQAGSERGSMNALPATSSVMDSLSDPHFWALDVMDSELLAYIDTGLTPGAKANIHDGVGDPLISNNSADLRHPPKRLKCTEPKATLEALDVSIDRLADSSTAELLAMSRLTPAQMMLASGGLFEPTSPLEGDSMFQPAVVPPPPGVSGRTAGYGFRSLDFESYRSAPSASEFSFESPAALPVRPIFDTPLMSATAASARSTATISSMQLNPSPALFTGSVQLVSPALGPYFQGLSLQYPEGVRHFSSPITSATHHMQPLQANLPGTSLYTPTLSPSTLVSMQPSQSGNQQNHMRSSRRRTTSFTSSPSALGRSHSTASLASLPDALAILSLPNNRRPLSGANKSDKKKAKKSNAVCDDNCVESTDSKEVSPKNSVLKAVGQRLNRRQAEKMRRDKLKAAFDDMKTLLPKSSSVTSDKPSVASREILLERGV
ncbi:hypothetical protein HDU84_006163 [Entophlyctis sp. JEL0112]|nr:hypothetical protein HDU84_006163 [Entophlyctis sp. JEL0112]